MVVPAELRQVADRARPVTLARDRTLPVAEPLQPLLPDGALARGSAVAVAGTGATSLALSLLAAPSLAGSWVVVVGLPELGLAAAAEAGIDHRRLALVAAPEPGRWGTVAAALVGGVDLVVVDGRAPITASEGRRLASRVRERGSVLVTVCPGSLPPLRRSGARSGAWPVDVTLSVAAGRWEGLGAGHGHLRRRWARVEAEGRGRASRPRRAELWLPAEGGGAVSSSSGRGSVAARPGAPVASTPPGEEHSTGSTVVAFPAGRRAG